MESNNSNNKNQNQGYIYCRASDITKMLKTPMDRKNIAKELSKYFI